MRLRFEKELQDLGFMPKVDPRSSTWGAAEFETPQARNFIPVEELERKYPVKGFSEAFSKFRSLVYMAQVRRAMAKKKKFIDNLQSLLTVENVAIHPSAAKPLKDLLFAARSEITRQGKQIEVKAGNAYRSADWQLKTWATARFPQYYKQATTETIHKKTGKKTPPLIAADDFSESAARTLAVYIGARFAAPGFSNHQHGLAVDFHTTEDFDGKSQTLKASFAQRDLWWKSWLWTWLEKGKNAYRFGFMPYKKEPWHWEYRPQKAALALGQGFGTRSEPRTTKFEVQQPQPTSPPGLLRIRYTSSVLRPYKDKHNELRSTDCSIVVPSALRGRPQIDLLVFFHGLDACSPKHDFDSDKVIKNFQMADQIDNAKRKVALAVPVVHWKTHKKGEKKNTSGIWSAVHLNAFIEEVLDQLGKHHPRPSLGQLIIAGHSRAYEVMTPLASEFINGSADTRKGPLMRLAEVWAFDSTYGSGHADALGEWAGKSKNVRFSVVLHKRETLRIKDRTIRTPLSYWNASSASRTSPKNLLILKVDESHCDIPKKHIGTLLAAQ